MRLKSSWIFLGLVPISVLTTLLLFQDSAKRYSNWVGPWPSYLAQPSPNPHVSRTDHILLFPVRSWDRRGLAPGEYPHYVHADDSESAWTIRGMIQTFYVYAIGVFLFALAKTLLPRCKLTGATKVGLGLVFLLLFVFCNIVEWPHASGVPAYVRGWPLWITARDNDVAGGGPPHIPGLVANTIVLLLFTLGAARLVALVGGGECRSTSAPKEQLMDGAGGGT